MKTNDIAEIEGILEGKGVKPTSNRILVLRELKKSSHPLALADLEELLDYSMDKASIFRVLELFTRQDVVHAIQDGSRSVKYELCHSCAEHSVADQHVHFYCERCGELFCLEDVHVPLVSVPKGFTAHSINYMIKGLCHKCANFCK